MDCFYIGNSNNRIYHQKGTELIWNTILIIIGILLLAKTIKGKPLTRLQIFEIYYRPAVTYGRIYGIPPSIILSIIEQESSGNASAVGTVGEVGLMQLTQGALTDFNRANGTTYDLFDMFNPELNIRVGSWYFAHVRKSFNNDHDGIRAYNAGVRGATDNPNLAMEYANKVLDRKKHFREIISKNA